MSARVLDTALSPLSGVPEWAARAQRAHLNLLQNLAPFAILVLVAQVSGKANATTALGETIFLWARVAHAAICIAGIKYLRTLVFVANAICVAEPVIFPVVRQSPRSQNTRNFATVHIVSVTQFFLDRKTFQSPI